MGMIEMKADEHTFHVFMFYEYGTDHFMKQISFVQMQYEKNVVLHIAYLERDFNLLKETLNQVSQHEKFVLHEVQQSPFTKVFELVCLLRGVDNGWICLLKPGDEWLPYHLSAFRDALIHFKGFKTYYALNYQSGYKAIRSTNPLKNIVDVEQIDLRSKLSLSQLLINSSLFKSNVFPDFKVDSHFDSLFELILICSSSMVRINRFTNICNIRKQVHNRSYFDQQTLIVCYLIRNIVKDHKQRFQLLITNWRIGFIGLLKTLRLFSAGIFFKEMLCYYVGMKRGIKKGQIYVD